MAQIGQPKETSTPGLDNTKISGESPACPGQLSSCFTKRGLPGSRANRLRRQLTFNVESPFPFARYFS